MALSATVRTRLIWTPNFATSSFEQREILEVFSLDGRVDVHHRQLSLREAGEFHGMGERRLVGR